MQIKEITEYLNSIFPIENAMSYDNPGLLTGDESRCVTGCVLSLDCTTKATELAKKNGFNLLITHHPLIFTGIKSVNSSTVTGRILGNLIKSDVAYYACHTNLDLTNDFGNYAIAEALGADNAVHCEGCACGVIYENHAAVSLATFSKMVARQLCSSGIITINNPDKQVKKVFVQGGSFDEESIQAVIASGADTVLSGEIKHHVAVFLEELGINTVIAGHSATEQIYLPKLEKVLEERFPQVKFIVNNNNESYSVL